MSTFQSNNTLIWWWNWFKANWTAWFAQLLTIEQLRSISIRIRLTRRRSESSIYMNGCSHIAKHTICGSMNKSRLARGVANHLSTFWINKFCRQFSILTRSLATTERSRSARSNSRRLRARERLFNSYTRRLNSRSFANDDDDDGCADERIDEHSSSKFRDGGGATGGGGGVIGTLALNSSASVVIWGTKKKC